MWDNYVEVNEKYHSYKFLWPGVLVKGNIVLNFMKKGTKVFSADLIKHYNHVDSFMGKYLKTFWQTDLIAF